MDIDSIVVLVPSEPGITTELLADGGDCSSEVGISVLEGPDGSTIDEVISLPDVAEDPIPELRDSLLATSVDIDPGVAPG